MYSPLYRTKSNGVPVLSKKQIDVIAERFIKDFCPDALKAPRAIDIDSLVVNYLKLKQDFLYLSHCGLYLGMMVFNNTRKVIVYNPYKNRAEYADAREGTVIIDNTLLEESQECRYRFTMGHEGAHWIFHRGYFRRDSNRISMFDQPGEALIQCRAAVLEGRAEPPHRWSDNDTMEWQANYMSSALLMPKSMVLSVYSRSTFKKLADLTGEDSDLLRIYSYSDLLVNNVASTFNVSNQAAEIRLKNLGLIRGKNNMQAQLYSAGAIHH